jgi:xanthine dehydrogenase YagT iron-sulfur-binding subunit
MLRRSIWSRRTVLGSAAAAIAVGTSRLQAQPPDLARNEATAKVTVSLDVNGDTIALTVDPRTTLLDLLREDLALKGTKRGCDQGQCGACTVLVNGIRINACLSLAVMHDGDSVVTIEGLGTPDDPHPLQAAFVAHDGMQCGYCTPGQICSAIGALDEIEAGIPSQATEAGRLPAVTADELRERLSGNLCRCSAYPNIVAAVLEVAQGGGR